MKVGVIGAGTMGQGIAKACAIPEPIVPAPIIPTFIESSSLYYESYILI